MKIKPNQRWMLSPILLAGLICPMFAQAGHFIMGAPGVLITEMTVKTDQNCFKQGDTLIISGHGFGSESAGHVISYATQGPMPIESWTDTEIQFHVPTAAEAPKFRALGSTLMILHGKDTTPTGLYGDGPVFCGSLN